MPTEPLSVTEKSLIRSTWAPFAADLKGVGCEFMIHFFIEYPDYQKLFKGFSDLPLDKLMDNKRFTAHSFTVLNAINGLVNSLDDPEMLEELLLKTGKNHGERQSLHRGDFINLQGSLLTFLPKFLKEKYTSEVQDAWTKVLTGMMATLGDGAHSLDEV